MTASRVEMSLTSTVLDFVRSLQMLVGTPRLRLDRIPQVISVTVRSPLKVGSRLATPLGALEAPRGVRPPPRPLACKGWSNATMLDGADHHDNESCPSENGMRWNLANVGFSLLIGFPCEMVTIVIDNYDFM